MTHPAIVQMVSLLTKAGLVNQSKSSNDRRKTLVKLTVKGKEEIKEIEPITAAIKDAITSVINLIDSNFLYVFSKLEQAVKSKLLVKTIEEDLRQRKMKDILIIPYQRKYKADFEKLNYEWLEKYSQVEEEDKTLWKYPEREIIKKGGEVFFALEKDKAVGTCAIVKVNNNIYELVKIVVTKEAQGKQIGKKLTLTSIGYAVEKGAKKLALNMSVKQNAAINLFKSLGFKKVRDISSSRNERELIHMELDLTME